MHFSLRKEDRKVVGADEAERQKNIKEKASTVQHIRFVFKAHIWTLSQSE